MAFINKRYLDLQGLTYYDELLKQHIPIAHGYYDNGTFYSDSAKTTAITPEEKKLYVDLANDKIYEYKNNAYTEVGSAASATYESKPAAQGGTDVSLVTTGEKYTWNNKQNALTLPLSVANGGTGNSDGYIRTGQKSGTTIGTGATIEGSNNTASGNYSHAGGYNTTAGYANQTTIGKYNDNKSTTLFEVGNGTSSSEKSNAFEVHSNGNVVITGDLSILKPSPSGGAVLKIGDSSSSDDLPNKIELGDGSNAYISEYDDDSLEIYANDSLKLTGDHITINSDEGVGGTAIDTTPTSGSSKLVTSGGVATALAGKQNTLTLPLTVANGGTGNIYGKVPYLKVATITDANVATSGGVEPNETARVDLINGNLSNHAPTANWYNILTTSGSASGSDYAEQLAFGMTTPSETVYYRRKTGGMWQSWQRLAFASEIPDVSTKVSTSAIYVTSGHTVSNTSYNDGPIVVFNNSSNSGTAAGIGFHNTGSNGVYLHLPRGSSGNHLVVRNHNSTTTSTLAFTSDIPTKTSQLTNDSSFATGTYGGGTKVTLNGSNKGGSTASFYAPTSAGTSGYYLKSNGSGAPTWAAVPSGGAMYCHQLVPNSSPSSCYFTGFINGTYYSNKNIGVSDYSGNCKFYFYNMSSSQITDPNSPAFTGCNGIFQMHDNYRGVGVIDIGSKYMYIIWNGASYGNSGVLIGQMYFNWNSNYTLSDTVTQVI